MMELAGFPHGFKVRQVLPSNKDSQTRQHVAKCRNSLALESAEQKVPEFQLEDKLHQ